MKKNNKTPKLRFSGYTDDWEQRKLNEIADKVSEKNKNNEFSEPFTNSAEQGIISQKDYFDREIVNNENLNGYYIVRNDDFIYNPRISARLRSVKPKQKTKRTLLAILKRKKYILNTYEVRYRKLMEFVFDAHFDFNVTLVV